MLSDDTLYKPRRELYVEDGWGFRFVADRPRRASRDWRYWVKLALGGAGIAALIFWLFFFAVLLYAERVGW